MKLNHLDLSVSDVPQTRDFFVEHFDFTSLEARAKKSEGHSRHTGIIHR